MIKLKSRKRNKTTIEGNIDKSIRRDDYYIECKMKNFTVSISILNYLIKAAVISSFFRVFLGSTY